MCANRGAENPPDKRFCGDCGSPLAAVCVACGAENREHSLIFDLAVTELEHGEWLVRQGRSDETEPLLAEAQETFERLEATPWLERALAVRPPVQEPV